MGYQELYKESNEAAAERYELVLERISQICEHADVKEPFADYFEKTASFLMSVAEVMKLQEEQKLLLSGDCLSLEELQKLNAKFCNEIEKEHYETSYLNPAYAKNALGEEFGALLCMLAAHERQVYLKAFRGDKMMVTIAFELFVEVYTCFEDEDVEKKSVEQAIYWYFHDYSELFEEQMVSNLVNPENDFATHIVMDSDLEDLRFLYQYGQHVGPDEIGIAKFLNTMSEEQIQAMADTYTEGYRIGFVATGKDLSKKTTVDVRYPIGFERMVRAALRNFEKMGLKPVMGPYATSVNKQYEYDHREDMAAYFDKAYVERRLECRKAAFEACKELAAGYAGPAVIEVFGEVPFSPVTKEEALKFDEKQQQLSVYDLSQRGQMTNQYIKGEERSFTIIAYPIPSIGEKFEEIFAETVKINTLDYTLYQNMQQKLIDVLDDAKQVHITGKGANKTDLYVSIYPLKDKAKETAFENCVADVNIPVGEVFTSPVLAGTTGKLFVSQVYLNELKYLNLEVDFKDGMISNYNCTNFEKEEDNKKYIFDNVLFHHETLPMGEFAIGTNTTAYRMAREFDIADKLPILIAEKTGPHFAVGDTCYSHEEDNVSYNPDGKQIVARENAVSALRKEDMSKAYFNCHTDITIPYDELDKITVIKEDGTEVDVIADGKFVVPGTEELNVPLN
ncbi:aminopeptidase [Roseburia sp. 831b]|uniref:aminopeptidase n=1 Tax=Roseburia sp. 831b TaxID=1261635 RepID=UPI0009533E49|nr:aminopeptidase [Roseburia sp. 831b]WVK73315.1 aminopeptidase [Roseburia sp. 831b]